VYSVRSHQSHYDAPEVDRFRPADFDPESFDEPAKKATGQRDSFIDLAKWDLKNVFAKEPQKVFYQRQLQVMFEKKYFHWITVRALPELVQQIPCPRGFAIRRNTRLRSV